jgi:hypothetical protein
MDAGIFLCFLGPKLAQEQNRWPTNLQAMQKLALQGELSFKFEVELSPSMFEDATLATFLVDPLAWHNADRGRGTQWQGAKVFYMCNAAIGLHMEVKRDADLTAAYAQLAPLPARLVFLVETIKAVPSLATRTPMAATLTYSAAEVGAAAAMHSALHDSYGSPRVTPNAQPANSASTSPDDPPAKRQKKGDPRGISQFFSPTSASGGSAAATPCHPPRTPSAPEAEEQAAFIRLRLGYKNMKKAKRIDDGVLTGLLDLLEGARHVRVELMSYLQRKSGKSEETREALRRLRSAREAAKATAAPKPTLAGNTMTEVLRISAAKLAELQEETERQRRLTETVANSVGETPPPPPPPPPPETIDGGAAADTPGGATMADTTDTAAETTCAGAAADTPPPPETIDGGAAADTPGGVTTTDTTDTAAETTCGGAAADTPAETGGGTTEADATAKTARLEAARRAEADAINLARHKTNVATKFNGLAQVIGPKSTRCYICDKEIATGLNDIGNVNRHMVPKDPDKGKTAEVRRLKQRHIDVVAAARDCITNGTTASETNIALLAACMGDDRVQKQIQGAIQDERFAARVILHAKHNATTKASRQAEVDKAALVIAQAEIVAAVEVHFDFRSFALALVQSTDFEHTRAVSVIQHTVGTMRKHKTTDGYAFFLEHKAL